MIFLPKPLPDTAPEDIFKTCVETFRPDTRARLRRCAGLVERDADSYGRLVPERIDAFEQSALPADVSAEDLVKVYTRKFVPEDQPGRQYYDAIMAGTKRGVCPICGVRPAYTLDHYLPKGKVPTLAVAPVNLIPACRDCNMDKNADMSLDPAETPVHIYLDRVPDEPWLHARIGEGLEVTYTARCPETWESGIRSRVEKHLDHYKLHLLYSSQAAAEIADMEEYWRELLTACDEADLRAHICRMRKSAEKNGKNSWKAALYRGLEADFDILLRWLEKKESGVPAGAL